MSGPELHAWRSPNTGCEMSIRRFGGGGRAVIYLPGSEGDETEFEQFGMPEAAAAWIDQGRAQFFSIDGRGPDTLWNVAVEPRERIRRYAAFERYAARELLPWVAERSADPRPILVGVSYGAHVAANLLFKQTEHVELACGLGGVYGMWHRLDGYHDDDVYIHTPLEYLPRLEDPQILGSIRAGGELVMYAGASDEWLHSTQRMADVMSERKLPHAVHVWPAPADHHERWWRRQLVDFLGKYV